MKTDTPVLVHRSDYQPTDFLIDAIDLDIDIHPEATEVAARLTVRLNPARPQQIGQPTLILDGDNLQTVDLQLDGQPLAASDYSISDEQLRIPCDKTEFELYTVVKINPAANTTLSGLYRSNANYYTQCEAQGFRRITWFADRPDVMATYTVRIVADKAACPVLLSNGNLVDSGDLAERPGWHWARWEDPFPKPSYLFALVAGQLVCTEQTVQTASGKDRLLQVWVEPGNEDKTDHAMASLVRSLRWDESRYGLELDLDRFMIVAVSDFNMGAMENKGLNIFNTKYVFANPRIATDTDFANVESVVGHEYFHNWTGNRVTCRDWFQLTLKEGLTVFRDQEFSADMMAAAATSEQGRLSARVVKRIEDVRLLRVAQFAEDAGPMAHPIRPDSYSEINNFYTVTVYEKGAEVIRMLQTLVGVDGFRRGMDLYFERHDGQAVTCDDFVSAVADANGRDFSQFRRWYAQAGTPVVRVSGRYDASSKQYEMTVRQMCPPTPGQDKKEPFHLPLSMALLDPQGQPVALQLDDSQEAPAERVLELTEQCHEYCFRNVEQPVVPSLLRGFSAPVVLDYPYSSEELAFLARHENDPFNRWEAIQRLAVNATLATLNGNNATESTAHLQQAMAGILASDTLDPAYQALTMTLPGEGYIAEQLTEVDPVKVRDARNAVRETVTDALHDGLNKVYNQLRTEQPYQADPTAAGQRALKNLALTLLVQGGSAAHQEAAWQAVQHADNMTDQAAALSALVNSNAPQREQALAAFAGQFADEPLVMDKWFTLQATMHRQDNDPPVLDRVLLLAGRDDFTLSNPNRVRSLIGAFCSGNLAEFHAADGRGYQFWLEQVSALDRVNPQVAARLARAMDRWRKFDPARQARMKDALARLSRVDGLSRDVAEIVHKALAG